MIVETDIQYRTSPPSILSQLNASSSPFVAPSNGTATPLQEAWHPTPSAPIPESPIQATNDWATDNSFDQRPLKGHSNGASLAGSPPQHRPSSDELRGGFAHTSPPTSPRAVYRQPVPRNGEYQSFGDYLGSSPGSRRPASMQSQPLYLPPPPHHTQAHYYGAPEIEFGYPKPNSKGKAPGEGFCCVFDTLPSAGPDSSKNTDNILLVGFEHGLNIYQISEKRFDRIGRLEGLRGSVIGAQILPAQSTNTRQGIQPLVAIIIHGRSDQSSNPSKPGTAQAEPEEFDPSGSMLHALHVVEVPQYYQTTVEVHSLRQGVHVATLFSSPIVEANGAAYHARPSRPPPIGDLTIQVNGKFIVVGSGNSGEVFIFESSQGKIADSSPRFRCIGKTWTRTSSRRARSMSISSSESGLGGLHDASDIGFHQPKVAILSLSHRWLAVVPPPPSSQTTLHGQIDNDLSGGKVPGLTSHTSETEPQVTCDLDPPQNGSILNRMAKDVAQGALKGAQWVAAEGMQVWHNYWSKPSEQRRQTIATSPPDHPSMGQLPAQQHFPPTHAQDNQIDRAKNQPTLVSVLDLEKLSQSQNLRPALALQPLATFSLPAGCSLVSFSPDGLRLLTASAKGDDQYVWDLMRMVHGEAGRAGEPDASPRVPSVREIAHFSRMTEARIIDVVWTEPRGERLAIITDRGTVHMDDITPSAFLWPPLRRVRRTKASPSGSGRNDNKNDDAMRPMSTDSTFSSALGIFTGKTQPLLAAVRGRSPSTGGRFPGFGTLAMTAGAGRGKAVAAGINRSVSAAATGTVDTLRHLGENRITLPLSLNAVAPGCVRWLSRKAQGRIAVTGGGIVRVYSVHQRPSRKAGQGRPSVIGSKPVEFSLPKEPVPFQQARDIRDAGAPPPAGSSASPGSFWLPHPPSVPTRQPGSDTHPLSYAEIDTSAPYTPFHADRRVNLYVYDENTQSKDPHHLHEPKPWVFGETIAATKISLGSATDGGDSSDTDQPTQRHMENVIDVQGNVEEGQQVVMTTRRKRNKKVEEQAVADNDDEIFDDFAFVDLAEERV